MPQFIAILIAIALIIGVIMLVFWLIKVVLYILVTIVFAVPLYLVTFAAMWGAQRVLFNRKIAKMSEASGFRSVVTVGLAKDRLVFSPQQGLGAFSGWQGICAFHALLFVSGGIAGSVALWAWIAGVINEYPSAMRRDWPAHLFNLYWGENFILGCSVAGLIATVGYGHRLFHQRSSVALAAAARTHIQQHQQAIRSAQSLFNDTNMTIELAARAALRVPSVLLRDQLGGLLDECQRILLSEQVIDLLSEGKWQAFETEVKKVLSQAQDLLAIANQPPEAGPPQEPPGFNPAPITTVAEALSSLGHNSATPPATIRDTIKRLLMKYHPDKNGPLQDSPLIAKALLIETQRVIQARDILRHASFI